jgi:hypothetical protein
MKIKIALSLITLVSCQLVRADETTPNLFQNGDFEIGKIDNFSSPSANISPTSQEDAYEGNHALQIMNPNGATMTDVIGTQLIPVDPAKEYTLSMMLKSGGEIANKEVHVGLACFDAEEKLIVAQTVNRLDDTETELLADASPGDTVLKVKKADLWKAVPIGFVAFNADDSGQFMDLPNYALSPMGIKTVTNKGDFWEIELAAPMTRSFSAGTKVRQHMAGNKYLFCTVINKAIPKDWKQFSGKATGTSNRVSNSQFWPGTRYVQVVILPGAESGQRLIVDNIKLEELVP